MTDYLGKNIKLAHLDRNTSALMPLPSMQNWGKLQIDWERQIVHYGDRILTLSNFENALLEILLGNTERYYPHSLLLERLWSVSSPLQEAELQTEIQQLRERLKSIGIDNLIETVYGIGYRLNLACLQPASVVDAKQQQMEALVAKVWERAKPNVLEQLAQIQKATQALLSQGLDQASRKTAEGVAHKLAGSLGTFGLLKGSELAKKIETIYESDLSVVEQQMHYLQELVVDLHLLVEQTTAETLQSTKRRNSLSVLDPKLNRPLHLLLVDAEPSVSLQIMAQAQAQGMKIAIASHAANAKQLLINGDYDAVLLQWQDLVRQDVVIDSLADLSSTLKKLGLIIFSNNQQLVSDFSERSLSIRGIFSPQSPIKAVIEVLKRLLQPDNTRPVRVLAVDDDPAILEHLQLLLEPWGLHVTGLSHTGEFWETLEATNPEIAILDLEMPQINGLELCQQLRVDPRWGWLPVLFLTAKNDPQTIEQVFSVGADDYVSKPMVASELVTRILNRLQRTQILRQRAETDWLTGATTWYKSTQDLSYWFDLADCANQPLSLVVLEVDSLKEVNQKYGHAVGDDILRCLGQLLRHKLRSEDAISRWGGAEFAVGMYGINRQLAIEIMTDILAAWRLSLPNFDGFGSRLTSSVIVRAGVAQYPDDGLTLPVLYQAARQSLVAMHSYNA